MAPLTLPNGKFGGAAHAQHQPYAVDEIVGRDGQVQRRQTLGAQALGYKKGVGQNIAGCGQRAPCAQQGKFQVFME